MTKKTRRIGVSAASLQAHLYGSTAPEYLGQLYQETGIPFQLELGPEWTREMLEQNIPAEAVISFLVNKGDERATWMRELYRQAYTINLGGYTDRDLVEASPATHWREAPFLAYSTFYTRLEKLSHVEFNEIIPRVKLVYIHPESREELEDFVKGEASGGLRNELRYLKRLQADFIIDIPAHLLWKGIGPPLFEFSLKAAQELKNALCFWLYDGL